MHLTALRPALLGEKSQSPARFTAREIIEHERGRPIPHRFSSITVTGGIRVAEGRAREGWLHLEIEAPVSRRKQWC